MRGAVRENWQLSVTLLAARMESDSVWLKLRFKKKHNYAVFNKAKALQQHCETTVWQSSNTMALHWGTWVLYNYMTIVAGGLSRSCGKRVQQVHTARTIGHLLLYTNGYYSKSGLFSQTILQLVLKYSRAGKQLKMDGISNLTNQRNSTNRYPTMTTKVHSAL